MKKIVIAMAFFLLCIFSTVLADNYFHGYAPPPHFPGVIKYAPGPESLRENVSCSTCSYDFDNGTEVTLTATPNVGYRFTGWTGGGCESAGVGPCTVTINEYTAVKANYELISKFHGGASMSGGGSL